MQNFIFNGQLIYPHKTSVLNYALVICFLKGFWVQFPHKQRSNMATREDRVMKLVETFLIVVVSQNVFSTEMDNPIFFKVFQLAPGGGGFAKKFCPGGWWNSP